MASLDELIAEKVRRLTLVPDEFLSSVENAQKELFPEVVELLMDLKVDADGNLIFNNSNLELTAELKDSLNQILLGSEYTSAVKEFAKEFDKQAKITNQIFRKGFDFTDTKLQEQLVKISKKSTSEILLDNIGDQRFSSIISQQVELAVSNGASFKETVKSIRGLVEGDGKTDGKLLQYSKQIAHDQFAIADRSYTSAVADELDAEWFFYSGNTIDSTREFCQKRHNKYFYYKEIEEWADEDWDGKIDGTNEKTIYSTAGGYNCRHSIIPVSIFAVPKDVIRRNISNGNFNPSEALLKQLKL